MVLYKYGQFLRKTEEGVYDNTYHPETAASFPGIYRCTKCGHEIGIAEGHIL